MKYFLILLLVSLVLGCAAKVRPMVVSPTADGIYWVLREPLVYKRPDNNNSITVPRGFVSDFASVPRIFWIAFPRTDKYTAAAVVHDYLYWQQPSECDQECADDLLLVAMEQAQVDYITRNAIYSAVRIAGSDAYEENALLKSQGEKRIIPEHLMDFGASDTWQQIHARILDAKRAY